MRKIVLLTVMLGLLSIQSPPEHSFSLPLISLPNNFEANLVDLQFKPLPPVKNSFCPSLTNLRKSLYSQLGMNIPVYVPKKEIKIAIIDTGIDVSNVALRKRIYRPNWGYLPENFYGFDLINNSFSPQDLDGHGTHVSGIITGLFPEAKILPIKVFEHHHSFDSFTRAIDLAVDAQVDIINISGGGANFEFAELASLLKAQAKGILVVSAAGNNFTNLDTSTQKFYPAFYKLGNIISVMANDPNGKKAPYSNYGELSVDISALGHVLSYLPNSINSNCEGYMEGTSQATPIVTATAAILWATNPNLSYLEIKKLLLLRSDTLVPQTTANKTSRLNMKRTISGTIATTDF